jgi:hypothetical protein
MLVLVLLGTITNAVLLNIVANMSRATLDVLILRRERALVSNADRARSMSSRLGASATRLREVAWK